MSIKFEFLQHAGESIVVTLDDKQSILIDGGCSHPFDNNFDKEASQENISTIIITHIDDDHIAGVISLLENTHLLHNLKTIIFNEPRSSQLFSSFNKNSRTSTTQGNKLASLIEKNKKLTHLFDVCMGQNQHLQLTSEVSLKILSPSAEGLDELHKKWNLQDYKVSNRRTSGASLNENDLLKGIDELALRPLTADRSLPNKSSLAFILEAGKRKFLLLGDAHIDQVISGLKYWGYSAANPLNTEFVKLSHHGSRCNINQEFLELVKTNTFIVCQAYENLFKHPDRETIAKIAKYGQVIDQESGKLVLLTKDTHLSRHLAFPQDQKIKYNFSIKPISQQTLTYKV